jgi:hypothetical protein
MKLGRSESRTSEKHENERNKTAEEAEIDMETDSSQKQEAQVRHMRARSVEPQTLQGQRSGFMMVSSTISQAIDPETEK